MEQRGCSMLLSADDKEEQVMRKLQFNETEEEEAAQKQPQPQQRALAAKGVGGDDDGSIMVARNYVESSIASAMEKCRR